MKVLHLVHNYFPSVGGSQLLVQKVAEGLVRDHGDEVTVFTTNAMKNPSFIANELLAAGDEQIRGVTVRRFKFWRRPLPILKRVLRVLRRTSKIAAEYAEPLCMGPVSPSMLRAIADPKADVIACMAFPFLNMYYPFLLGRRRPRIVLFGALHLTGDHVPAPILKAVRDADAYVAFTEFEKRILVSCGAPAEKIHVIGLGVEVDTFAKADGSTLRARYGIGKAPLVAFVGRQAPHKGCDTLLRAMVHVWDVHPEAFLVMAGSRTSFSPTLDRIVSELKPAQRARVIMVHDFPESEKAQWFAACDVFASVSTEESFGISFVEAWAAGKPVIGGRIGAVECVVQENVDGLLVPCSDPEALAAALSRLLGDSSLRARLGTAGSAKVRAEHDWNRVVERIRHVYEGARE